MRLRDNRLRYRRSYRGRRKPHTGILQRFLLVGGVLAFSATLAATSYIAAINTINPPEGGGTATVVKNESQQFHGVLIDSSDPVTTAQKQQIDNLLKFRFMEPVRKNDQIAVALLTHEAFNPVEWVFTAVDPGKGSEANPLFETPAMVDQERKKTFLADYYHAVGAAQMPIDRPKTPLIAGLNALSRHHSFRGGYGDRNIFKQRRLLLVTDGLENARVSAYRGTLYGSRANLYVSQHLADFKGVEVTVALINRPKYRHIQNDRHWNWLQAYLQRSGASSVKRIDIM